MSDTPPSDSVPEELPVLPLRELVVFPYMVLPVFVARERSIAAVDDALAGDRLVMLLADNDRIDQLREVVAEIERLADEGAGRERAQVISAIDVTPEQTARIAAALEKRLGRPVLVDIEVDPEIRAGLICQIGDLTIDTSIRRQLDLIKETLTAGL